jgi:MoaA/NifB/PqqE/SkfB family radical SAM enzyme
MPSLFEKRRDRTAPAFANINLLGRCNARCYFCLGRDLGCLIDGRDDTAIHYHHWPMFAEFTHLLKARGVSKVYVTGQNTDALLYEHLCHLVAHLQSVHGFDVGLRTNGLLAMQRLSEINRCRDEVGYSINSLRPDTLHTIMGWTRVPDWDAILKATQRPRVSMVLGRYNVDEFLDVVRLVGRHPHVRYMQARRISTDNRQEELRPDLEAYEALHDRIAAEYPKVREFYGAPVYEIEGVEVTFWRTVQTSIGSLNYFTDGTISDEYFVVEGYLRNRRWAT